MGILGIFVDNISLGDNSTLREILRFRDAAMELGHDCHFLFPQDIDKVKSMD